MNPKKVLRMKTNFTEKELQDTIAFYENKIKAKEVEKEMKKERELNQYKYVKKDLPITRKNPYVPVKLWSKTHQDIF